MDVYENGFYDYSSNWISWNINGIKNASFIEVLKREQVNSIEWNTQPLLNVNDVRSEMKKHAENILNTTSTKISLAISGMDSEAIARILYELKADFDLWYLHFWFKNDKEIQIISKIAKDLKKDLHIIEFDWKIHKKIMYSSLFDTGCVATVKNCLPLLFAHIPEDNYIITGNENFRQVGKRFCNIYENHDKKPNHIPWDIRHLCLRFWAQKNKRKGCFCFYDSEIRLVSALLSDPYFVHDKDTGEISDKKVISENFPELLFKNKTDPFAGNNNIYPFENISNNSRAYNVAKLQQMVLEKKYTNFYLVFFDFLSQHYICQR